MFNNIIGNDKIKELLSKSVKLNNTSHSYLFIGTEGIGKKLIAKEFANMLLETEIDSPDLTIIEPDGNSIKIDQIRGMQEKVAEKPIKSEKKIYIINDSDKMTVEAQNCLLKTLEEPPEFVTIILIGTNENAFLTTIKSRCMILHFEKISNEEIKKYLQQNYETQLNSEIMIKACEGSIGKAIQIKDNQELYQEIEQIIINLENKDQVDIINMSEIIYKAKEEKEKILNYINVILLELAKRENKYTNCIEIVENTKKRLQSNANYDMCIDNMLLNMWEQVN